MTQVGYTTTPKVIDSVLYIGSAPAKSLQVGSPDWFAWLQMAHTFDYVGEAGTFTARREGNQQGVFWVAYRRVSGKLSKRYLGKPEDLTVEQLEATAASPFAPSSWK